MLFGNGQTIISQIGKNLFCFYPLPLRRSILKQLFILIPFRIFVCMIDELPSRPAAELLGYEIYCFSIRIRQEVQIIIGARFTHDETVVT